VRYFRQQQFRRLLGRPNLWSRDSVSTSIK
jgi:hypothetical protein